MGSCFKKSQVEPETFLLKVQRTIERDDFPAFEDLSKSEDFEKEFPQINNPYFIIKEFRLNLLGFAVYTASYECFTYIHTELNASIESMEKLLQEQKSSAIDLICQRGNVDLLNYYLPIFCSSCETLPIVTEELSLSLDFSQNNNGIPKVIQSTYTPIHKACDLGHLHVISNVCKYFKDKPIVPLELDIDYQDETTGENCALIACKTGNYSMIRFLHTTCHANFFLNNKLGECAVQILAASNKRKNLKEFHECMVYLINQIGVEFTHNYEETLLLIDNEKTVLFFEKKLKEKGIEIDKEELEEMNKLVKPEQIRSIEEASLDPYYGTNFNFKKLYNDVMKDPENEEISVISGESRNNTPFTSVLNDLPPI